MFSIMDSDRKRASSAPATRKSARKLSVPDPRKTLAPIGEAVTRTASALAELAAVTQHMPDTWMLQDKIADAVCHEILASSQKSWRQGIEHGKWLINQELLDNRVNTHELAAVRAKLVDLQMRFQMLETRYEEAQTARILNDISNQKND